MSNTTLLKVNLSKYTKPDEGYDIKPVNPDVPDTSDKDVNTGDHGFFTVSDTSNSDTLTYQNVQTISIVAFISFALILLFGLLLPKVVRKVRSQDSERYDLKRSHVSRLSFFSTIFASLSLLVGLVSSVVAYTKYDDLPFNVSDTLTASAEIINTDTPVYIKDTISLPKSDDGIELYLYAKEGSKNKLVSTTNDTITIDTVSGTGALSATSFGFSFVDPSKDASKFQPIEAYDAHSKVLSLSSEETSTPQTIDIWYGIKAKDAKEGSYQISIQYEAIKEYNVVSLQEMTPQICSELRTGTLDYTFINELDDQEYMVSKLADGNCWTKPVPSAPVDPDEPVNPEDPTPPVETVCPTGWHEAIISTETNIIDNNDALDIFYGNSTDTTVTERIADLKESGCVADYTETNITFDSNGGPDDVVMPEEPDPINSIDFKTTYTLPSPDFPDDILPNHFKGWSLDPDADSDGDSIIQPGTTVVLTSPDVIFYAIWDEKTPKAILDEDGLLNFVYDFYTIEDVIASRNDPNGYWAKYEAAHAPIIADDEEICSGGTDNICVYLVPENISIDQIPKKIPWTSREALVINPYIKKANFEESFKDFEPVSTSGWFYYLSSLTEVTGLENLNTSKTAEMSEMFSHATALTSLTLPAGFSQSVIGSTHIHTGMYEMFYYASSLEHINYRDENGNIIPDTLPDGFGQNTKNMNAMFSGAGSLVSLTLPVDFGSQAESMAYMFRQVYSLEHINYRDENGNIIPDTLPDGFGQKANGMFNMFDHTSLASITLPSGFGKNIIKTGTETAYDCDQQSVGNLGGLFEGTRSLEHINYRDENGNIIPDTLPDGFGQNVACMSKMFTGTALVSLSLPSGFGNQAISTTSMFEGTHSLEHINYRDENGNIIPDTLPDGFGQNTIYFYRMFYYVSSLASITLPSGFGQLSTEARNMKEMFYRAENLENIYVPRGTDWSILNIENSDNMFLYASKLPNYNTCSPRDITCAYEGEKDGVRGYFTDIAEKPTNASEPTEPDSSNSTSSVTPSYSPSYTPSIVEPVAEPDTTTTTPSTVPTTNNPQEGNTEPQGVIRREQVDRTDYALIIVVATSITLVFLGALTIYFIEKRDRDEENIDKY